MRFSDDPELEARIGKVCLVFARVEQEAGHAVASAHGNWDVMGSTDYLRYSSNSGLLHKWLKAVGKAYPVIHDQEVRLRGELRGLKQERDRWAHSAAVVDLFLVMREQGQSSMDDSEVPQGMLLHGQSLRHIEAPNQSDVDEFIGRASPAGDHAAALALDLAKLTSHAVRPVQDPESRNV